MIPSQKALLMIKFLSCICICCLISCASIQPASKIELPGWMKGKFIDDYGISYTITDSCFVVEPSDRYRIIKWDKDSQFILAQNDKNDKNNKTNKGLYTRIDYMSFTGMEPYTWGFCLTVYDAKDTAAALETPSADRNIPKKGCNGYPFSRMKRHE